jgi:hypothetical protein
VLTDHNKEMLRIAEQLHVTFETSGWKTVIKPLLDKMIMDCLGYKGKDGTWIAGALQKHDVDPDIASHYSKALIEFENRLMDHITIAKSIKEGLQKEQETEDEYKMPMTDTRYAI